MRVAVVGSVEVEVAGAFTAVEVTPSALGAQPDLDLIVVEPRAALVEQVGAIARLRRLPLLVATRDTGLSALRWLRLGASGLVAQTLDDGDWPSADSSIGVRVEHYARSTHLSLRLCVLPKTPLEGEAAFESGRLTFAQFCGLSGQAALAEMLQLDEPPIEVGASRPKRATHVLFVDDDPVICAMMQRRLEHANFRVSTANDGIDAFALLSSLRVDVVVSDLDMPRLDGWGLLSLIRSDVELRELPVVLLSAHEDQVEVLKAARGGARAYLSKLAPHRELTATIELLTEARRRATLGLEQRRDFEVSLVAVGAQWLLELLEELEASGRLEIEDELGRYELTVSAGRPVDAVAQKGSLRVIGETAVEALMSSRGVGQFLALAPAAEGTASMTDFINRVKRARLAQHTARFEQDERFGVALDRELADLYARSASVQELRVLEALDEVSQREGLCDPSALAAKTGLELAQTRRILIELHRRGVVITRS